MASSCKYFSSFVPSQLFLFIEAGRPFLALTTPGTRTLTGTDDSLLLRPSRGESTALLEIIITGQELGHVARVLRPTRTSVSDWR
jgi:hypothetical protein